MKLKSKKKKPYSQWTDSGKLKANWSKALGLFNRSDYSAAIIRAGTCAEIGANIVIRAELIQKRQLESGFVDNLLRWANGVRGKFEKLILPLFENTKRHSFFKRHLKAISKLNEARNEIAHIGRFASKSEARDLLLLTHLICTEIASNYDIKIKLRKP
jgi:hypothetical protein